ncbi:MAG: hypothetical protein U5K69_12435 [Balneolaceae bacterium]|nr:hypothetical protein [Balneolaceae bacterium]
MKDFIKKIPIVRFIARMGYYAFIELFNRFPGTKEYWEKRYDWGGTSGNGSYNDLAEFKAAIINRFIEKEDVETVIEYGCGDGNQLKLADYPSYIGFDVSKKAISRCRNIFVHDKTMTFKLMEEYDGETAQLTLSLDVIYHLIEDEVYYAYMRRLFDSSTQFVIIYSSNTNGQKNMQMKHIRHRKFSDWIEENRSTWKLLKKIPANGDATFTDFYIYEKTD